MRFLPSLISCCFPIAAVACFLFTLPLQAQSTYGLVKQIIATNCAVNCHNQADITTSLFLDEVTADIKTSLVGVVPQNALAAARGDKLVDPGYPNRSFLLRKLNDGNWEQHEDFIRSASDGIGMPKSSAALQPQEIELIRQWILFGCPDTGMVVDTQLLYDFYHVNGASRAVIPDAPADSLGFQLKYGPFFLAPQTEQEYLLKYALNNHSLMTVNRLDWVLEPRMHHFAINKFLGNNAATVEEGFRNIQDEVETQLGSSTTYVAGAQFAQSIVLPADAAYFWYPNMVFDFDGHCANTFPDSVLAVEAYVNVYYANRPDTALTEVFTQLTNYRGIYDSTDFVLFPGEEKTFTDSLWSADDGSIVLNLFMLASHTHKFGTSYRVYERDICGGKGPLIYDGDYDETYSYNQGFFDYEHPPVRYFDNDYYSIPLNKGFIQEATFYNYSNDTIYFGFTTKDEMMNLFLQFTVSMTTAIDSCVADTTGTSVASMHATTSPLDYLYPNPATNTVYLARTSNEPVDIAVYNVLGEMVLRIPHTAAGEPKIDVANLAPGRYVLTATTTNQSQVHALIVQ